VPESPEKPRLVALPGSEPRAAENDPEAESRSRRLVLLLGVALSICAVLLAAQLQRAGQLEARIQTLQGELDASRAELARWELRMGEIRTQVGDLAARTRALEALLSEAPAATGPASPEPQGATP
jgi:hypothetical protein